MNELPVFTYQTRIVVDASVSQALDGYAALYGTVERRLFAALHKPNARLIDLKREFLPQFGITARQFNAIRTGLEGKIASIKARRPELIQDLQVRIRKAARTVTKLSQWPSQANKLHEKKRRLHILQTKLAAMQAEQKADTVRLCFGSKKLFRAQFDLESNGYQDLDAWRLDWQASRSSQFFVLGSGDETAGNQSCQAHVENDGSLSLRLRLPDSVAGTDGPKYIELPGVRFVYGHQAIVDALRSSKRGEAKTKAGKAIIKRTGCAMSYRFVRDAKGWRVFVSCKAQAVQVISSRALGAIGVDINADHLAVSEIDRFGNWVHSRRIDLCTYGKTGEQTKALISDAALVIAGMSKALGKPVVLEELNFAKKKAELETSSPRYARMLSSFASNKAISSIRTACFRAGGEVIEVNPAYTSVIGAVNHAQSKGISVHMGAATAIARRGLGLSERVPKRAPQVPARSGGHVTFCLPARNRQKHVWSQWASVRTNLKAALAAHDRSGGKKRPPAPLTPAKQSLGAHRSSMVRFHGANRQQHCSADVPETLEDVPF
jgi:IS605 OrfB family transposase